MATIQQTIDRVDDMLRSPKSQQPSTRQRMKTVLAKYQSLLNTMNNTGLAWATGEFNLDVQGSTEDYEITQVSDFGKALLVTSRDPSNPAHIERAIDVFNVQNIDAHWWLPNNYAGWFWNWDGSNTTADRIAFYRKGGASNVFARVKPIPQLSASYRVLYEIGNWADSASLQLEMLLPEHHELVAVRAAISLLPSADWSDDEKLNSGRRNELAQALKNDESEYGSNFLEHIRTVSTPKMNTRRGAGGF